MHKIIYTKRAKVELENLYNYIYFNLTNPIAAKRFKANIIKPISNLEYFPYMGKKILNSKFRYLIFYSVNNQNVEIQRIIHKNQKVKYI